MSEKKQSDHKADTSNKNEGTKGTNPTYQKGLDNRGNQLNPNHQEFKGVKNSK